MKRNTNTHTPIEPQATSYFSLNEVDSIELIDELLLNGLVKDALMHTQQAKLRYPTNSEFNRREADIYFNQEIYDKALRIYNTINIEKQSPKRLLSYAVKLMNCKQLDDAEAILNELKSSTSNDISSRAYSILADISFLKNDYRAMYRWSREAIKRNPFIDSFAEKFYIAIELTNNHHKSIPFYEVMLDENPYSALMWLHLSKCHAKLGFSLQAKDCMEMVSTIDTMI
jgi:tetratricopeptide (TPR) repeat protein